VTEHRDSQKDLAMPDPAPANQTTQQKPKAKGGPVAAIVLAVLVVIALVNSNDDDPAPSSATDPVITAEPEARADAAEPEAALPQDGGDGSVADTAVVPDVVGLDHQLAQDTLQANGFYLLQEEDATGQGRMLLYDRNWVVVSQSAPGGTSAATTTAITLYSKKIGE
jgi:hypothetical protein